MSVFYHFFTLMLCFFVVSHVLWIWSFFMNKGDCFSLWQLFLRGVSVLLMMAPPLLMVLMVVAMATGTHSVGGEEENELDYGYWNYREGGKSWACVWSFHVARDSVMNYFMAKYLKLRILRNNSHVDWMKSSNLWFNDKFYRGDCSKIITHASLSAKVPDTLRLFALWIKAWWHHVFISADRVNVASVRSVTRVLDVWGKRIFNEIKTLLHSQPSTLLPDYSR